VTLFVLYGAPGGLLGSASLALRAGPSAVAADFISLFERNLFRSGVQKASSGGTNKNTSTREVSLLVWRAWSDSNARPPGS